MNFYVGICLSPLGPEIATVFLPWIIKSSDWSLSFSITLVVKIRHEGKSSE